MDIFDDAPLGQMEREAHELYIMKLQLKIKIDSVLHSLKGAEKTLLELLKIVPSNAETLKQMCGNLAPVIEQAQYWYEEIVTDSQIAEVMSAITRKEEP